jgi:hypothetical protein
LGNDKEAREILKHEIAANTNAIRAVTLRWQLADVIAQKVDVAEVKNVLTDAAKAAKGTTMEAAALRRVGTLRNP